VELTSTNTGEEFTEEDVKFSYNVVEQTLQRGRPILTSNANLTRASRTAAASSPTGCVQSCARRSSIKATRWVSSTWQSRARGGLHARGHHPRGAFANQAASALANAQEHKKTDQVLAEKVRELTILQEMARDLNTSLKFERVMGTQYLVGHRRRRGRIRRAGAGRRGGHSLGGAQRRSRAGKYERAAQHLHPQADH
jgi:hypothetical protein